MIEPWDRGVGGEFHKATRLCNFALIACSKFAECIKLGGNL